MAKACGIENIKSAADRLQQLMTKYDLGVTTTGIRASQTVKLNAAAIATGGPATTSDRITKRATSFTKKGTARMVKKPTRKLCSAKQEEDIAKVNELEASHEGLTCVAADHSDLSSELTYFSTTEEDESVPTDENGRVFPGVRLDLLDDMGLTVSYLLAVKKARRTGTMTELMANKKPGEVAKILAAEELLKKAEEGK